MGYYKNLEIFEEGEIKNVQLIPFEQCNLTGNPVNLIKSYELCIKANNVDYSETLNFILTQLLIITKSELGGISELDNSTMKFIVLSDKSCSLENQYHDISQYNIFVKGISNKTNIISNDVPSDKRIKQCPKKHFFLEKFLYIPLVYEEKCIGSILLANKPTNYNIENIYDIYSLIKLCMYTVHYIQYKRKYNITNLLKIRENKLEKDDFIARLSHEMRTPLTGINGAITLLPESGPLNTKQQEYLKLATTCSIQLLDLINSILDFSKLSSHTLKLARDTVNIQDCIDKSILIVKTKANKKGINIISKISPDLPEYIIGDSKRLIQILINLLSNSIKFSDKGNIFINVNSVFIDENIRLEISVKDEGIGIAKDDLNKIFVPFSQLKNKYAYEVKDGVGLGLSITKQLIELMGGQIEVNSDGIGTGTTFAFYIMTEESINIDQYLKDNNININEINVLNIDDNMNNLLILDDMLAKYKINSTMCISAEQALRYLERGVKYNVAIIDIYMPYMSGIELAQHLRNTFPNLPLIALSSGENEEQGKELFDFYLLKPYNYSQIVKCIVKCIINKKNITYETPKLKTLKKTKSKVKIIVAEDDEHNQFIIREILVNLGYKNITMVSNGQECVNEVKQNDYDICLMDIKMPVMDGLEASKYIRQLKNKPIIIAISAGVTESDKHSCIVAGMNGHLSKPIVVQELDNMLKQFVNI